MKTCFYLLVGVALMNGVIYSDETRPETSDKLAPHIFVAPNLASHEIDPSFTVPVSKDRSGFTHKPLEKGIIKILPFQNPDTLLKHPSTTPQLFRIPTTINSDLHNPPTWKLENMPLGFVLLELQKSYAKRVLLCASPSKLSEDPKISMTLRGATIEDALTQLAVTGLSWCKIGEIYFIACNRSDLPSTSATSQQSRVK